MDCKYAAQIIVSICCALTGQTFGFPNGILLNNQRQSRLRNVYGKYGHDYRKLCRKPIRTQMTLQLFRKNIGQVITFINNT
jgi:hypothetical protein